MTTATITKEMEEKKEPEKLESPLPPDMLRILQEVAQTGFCSFLSWNEGNSDRKPSIRSFPRAIHPQQHSIHRRPTPLYAVATGGRKKHRNGLHGRSQRREKGPSRKRPRNPVSNAFSPGSVGSGRTSGSELEDTSQYDSEGTTTTTNSEISFDKIDYWRKQAALQSTRGIPTENPIAMEAPPEVTNHTQYKCLREVFSGAVRLVLDHYFEKRGGYKLSPAEKQRYVLVQKSRESKDDTKENGDEPMRKIRVSPEAIFRQRKQRLLHQIDAKESKDSSEDAKPSADAHSGPPFTVQRVAEVLMAPERCYTQTHKLCNCLEKLLLIKASAGAFGGSTGGDTLQSQLEERELAALADERGRVNSEYHHKRKRRASSISDELAILNSMGGQKMNGENKKEEDGSDASKENEDQEMLEAAARASLRTKFDHIGNDPHSAVVNNRDARAIGESRGMTNSPPPPSLTMGAAGAPGMGLPGHASLLRHNGHNDQDHSQPLARVPSPILFNHGNEAGTSHIPGLHNGTNMHLLQMHHASALAGVSPFELMGLSNSHDNTQSIPTGHSLKEADLESRSSGASSDTESDVSFDDSASDRSDGSDYEPFSAARALALSRIQQQQQRRLQEYGAGFRPPPDSEYQSGDSIDSTRAEDSGESDSSSSDVAD